MNRFWCLIQRYPVRFMGAVSATIALLSFVGASAALVGALDMCVAAWLSFFTHGQVEVSDKPSTPITKIVEFGKFKS